RLPASRAVPANAPVLSRPWCVRFRALSGAIAVLRLLAQRLPRSDLEATPAHAPRADRGPARAGARRGAGVAVQPGLGILPEQRADGGGSHPAGPRAHRAPVSRVVPP